MESEYIFKVRSDERLRSSFRSDTRLQSHGRGMHSNFAVKSVLGPYSQDAIMDLLYIFQIPSSAYIDVHEIESRFEFPWNVVNIHARSDNVDYESIYTGKVNDSTIGIEFVGVPLKAWSYGDGLFQWTFEMPLHLRYQMPALDSSQSFGIVTIHAPLLYIRSYHDRTCTVAYQDSEACSSYTQSMPLMNSKRRYKRYYDTSFLGNKGNSESIADDFHALNSQFDSTARYERPQDLVHTDAIDAVFANYSKEVVLSMPLGNAEDLPIVLWTTFAVTLLTTVGLLLLMIRKALGSSRRLENKVEEL